MEVKTPGNTLGDFRSRALVKTLAEGLAEVTSKTFATHLTM